MLLIRDDVKVWRASQIVHLPLKGECPERVPRKISMPLLVLSYLGISSGCLLHKNFTVSNREFRSAEVPSPAAKADVENDEAQAGESPPSAPAFARKA